MPTVPQPPIGALFDATPFAANLGNLTSPMYNTAYKLSWVSPSAPNYLNWDPSASDLFWVMSPSGFTAPTRYYACAGTTDYGNPHAPLTFRANTIPGGPYAFTNYGDIRFSNDNSNYGDSIIGSTTVSVTFSMKSYSGYTQGDEFDFYGAVGQYFTYVGNPHIYFFKAGYNHMDAYSPPDGYASGYIKYAITNVIHNGTFTRLSLTYVSGDKIRIIGNANGDEADLIGFVTSDNAFDDHGKTYDINPQIRFWRWGDGNPAHLSAYNQELFTFAEIMSSSSSGSITTMPAAIAALHGENIWFNYIDYP